MAPLPAAPAPARAEDRPDPDDLANPDDLERRLHRASTLHFLMTHRLAQALGLSQVELFAVNLVQLSGALSAGALARETGLTTSATTRLIDRLERHALLRRVPDPADRRRVAVQLDPACEARLNDGLRPLRALYREAAQGLTDAERRGLTRYLEVSSQRMETFVRRPPPCPEFALDTLTPDDGGPCPASADC